MGAVLSPDNPLPGLGIADDPAMAPGTFLDGPATAQRLLAALTPDENVLMVEIPGEPRSKARPRVTKHGGVYVDPKARKAEKDLKLALRWRFRKPLVGNIAVACVFYRSSKHRIDVDNCMKQILDAANGICWRDDSQVTALLGVLELDRDSPRTVLALAAHSSSLARDDEAIITCCEGCGKPFSWRRYPSHPERRFCSVSCASHSRGEDLTALATCRSCEEPFRRRYAGQVFCSEACRLRGLHDGNRQHPKPTCDICGGPVSRPEYRRCRDCWRRSF